MPNGRIYSDIHRRVNDFTQYHKQNSYGYTYVTTKLPIDVCTLPHTGELSRKWVAAHWNYQSYMF